VTHVLSITVVNRSDKVKRIRFKQPTTTEFALHQIPCISVAPGLEISADLEYFSAVEGDFSDELIVMCEDDKITIPVRAFAPRADMFFDGFCHFGGVAPESLSIRYVDVVNKGQKAADFKFLKNDVPQFEIEPLMGRLGPAGSDDCFIRVRVQFDAKNLGVFRSVVQMEVNSVVIGTTLDMSALVVRQKVELVSPDGAGKLDSVQFSTVYWGEERSQQVMFVNDGPEPLDFTTTIPVREGNNDEILPPVYTVTPSTSQVNGFEQKILTITFHPPIEKQITGWKQAQVVPEKQKPPKREEFPSQVPFAITGGVSPKFAEALRTELRFMGRAEPVLVQLSERDIEFIDTVQYDHVDMNLTIKNQHEELPIAFNVPKIAHFRCRPATGRLLPYQTLSIVVSFYPNQRGKHSGELNFMLHGATGQVVGSQVMTVRGNCHESCHHKKIPGGTLATHETFEPTLQFQSGESLAKQKGTVPRKFVRDKCWVKNPPEVTDATAKYTMDVDVFETINNNKDLYMVWLREEQAKRRATLFITETSAFALGNPAGKDSQTSARY